MKFFALLALLISASAQATVAPAVTFRKDTLLPVELREKIAAALVERCGESLSWGGAHELSTSMEEQAIDQGQTDLFYTSQIAGSWLFDGAPGTITITVESAEYAISNPAFDRFEVLKITADAPVCR